MKIKYKIMYLKIKLQFKSSIKVLKKASFSSLSNNKSMSLKSQQ